MIEIVGFVSSVFGIIMFVVWLSDEYKKRKVYLYKIQDDIATTDADKQNAFRNIGNKSDLNLLKAYQRKNLLHIETLKNYGIQAQLYQ